jgi:N-formylglutamate deformylase
VRLPLLISVAHAGLDVPPEVKSICMLSDRQVIEDGDEGAAEIYDFPGEVAEYVTTRIARAIVDVNRAEDDRRADGVIKTHTCWNVPVYREPLSTDLIEMLLERYHRPYHRRLSGAAPEAVLGVDCHTMAAKGPAVGPDPDKERPYVCLSNADGSCSDSWLRSLAGCLEETLHVPVSLNDPFKGGYIIRSHANEVPWVQLEISRAPFAANSDKRRRVLDALRRWCREERSSQ